MRISVDNTICMIIDYQEKIVPAMAHKEELLSNSIKLLKGLRVLGVPMIITGQYTKGLGLNVPEIFEAAETESYIDKMSFSSYQEPKVQKALGETGKHVILCGIEAHVCVLQTAMDLKAAGYQPVLVTDCISSRKESDKEIALIRAQQEGVLLTTGEAILFELTGAAGSDVFKQISKLVK